MSDNAPDIEKLRKLYYEKLLGTATLDELWRQVKKKKLGKAEREEYATIEADIEALEAAVVQAEVAFEESKTSKRRLGQMEMLEVFSAASDARAALDAKMERYLELDEMFAEA